MSVTKPRTLDDLWLWAHLESSWTKATAAEPPDRLHVSKSYPPDSSPPRRGKSGAQVVGAPPFTRAFERYLEGVRPMTAVRRALDQMRARGKDAPQSLEYRICFAVVENGLGVDHVRTIERAPAAFFNASAMRGLGLLWDLTQMLVSDKNQTVDSPSPGPQHSVKGTSAHIRASGRHHRARPAVRP